MKRHPIARLLKFRLQLLSAPQRRDLIDCLEPALRAYGHQQSPVIPTDYRQHMGAFGQWLAERLWATQPDAFWTLHKQWMFSKLKREPKPLVRHYQQDGHAFSLDIRWRTPFEHYLGTYEFGLIARLASLLNPDDNVLDIGANMGLFALPLSKPLNAGCVYAIEPNPDMLQILRAHVARNGLSNRIRVLPVAVAQSNSRMALSIPGHNPGGGSLLPGGVWDRPRDQRREVQVRAFSELYAEIGAPPVHLVKIDVEGYEPIVIDAMEAMLRLHRPVLALEISPSAYDAVALFTRLKDIGYHDIQQITNSGEIRPLTQPVTRQINVICRPSHPRQSSH